MSEYAIYDASRIYHVMRDEKHTNCGIRVFGSHVDDDYRNDQSPSRIVGVIPNGLRICPHCEEAQSVKKEAKQMNDDNDSQGQSPLMVEDEATEKLKKRAQDAGLIVNAGVGKTAKSKGASKKNNDSASKPSVIK